MATPAELLDNMVPVSAFSRGKAAQAFSSASNSTPVIVLKNNAPYRVITTPDEYAYLSEVEADMVLMAEAMARLTANQGAVESSSLIRRGIRKTSWEQALVPVERPDESEIEVGWHPDRVQA